ncbi:hypothetical protein AMTR_s00022p00191910 [Amborella trichopoda]|uniref:Apple domain-containing protein n=1 Tax=Amborella trichopoda TaxID=13333 RepID=W1PUW3_AMBTC|nr:hypothetical protein AMTR_s00022p00191910 [Amborella trichopoda]
MEFFGDTIAEKPKDHGTSIQVSLRVQSPVMCRGCVDYKKSDPVSFEKLDGVDWPNQDYEQQSDMDENECQKACEADCWCHIAIYRNKECSKKRIPLMDGKKNITNGAKALIKASDRRKKIDDGGKSVAGWILVGSSAFLLFVSVAAIAFSSLKKIGFLMAPNSEETGN